MVFSELSAVGLSAEQKTAVDAIESDLKKQTATVDGPKSQLDTDVADGSATGKLDKAKIDADVKTLVQAADSTALAVQDAMNRLHKLLDVAQRKKLVESLRAKAEKHRDAAMGAKPEEHHEHEKGAKGAKPEGHHEHGKAGHERMERLAAELGLTAEQREKLTTKLGTGLKADQANMKAHLVDAQKRMKAMFDAFVSDKFDAKKAGVGEHVGKMVEMTATGRVRFVEAVLSVLTPEQRGKFAEHLRQHAEESDEH
jgi:Spy/CpxP family protein refolding chaperone